LPRINTALAIEGFGLAASIVAGLFRVASRDQLRTLAPALLGDALARARCICREPLDRTHLTCAGFGRLDEPFAWSLAAGDNRVTPIATHTLDERDVPSIFKLGWPAGTSIAHSHVEALTIWRCQRIKNTASVALKARFGPPCTINQAV
jgi:hypothetical protein